jgi:hypothetical protein
MPEREIVFSTSETAAAQPLARPTTFSRPAPARASEAGLVGYYRNHQGQVNVIVDPVSLLALGLVERFHPTDAQMATYTGWSPERVSDRLTMLRRDRVAYLDFDARWRPTSSGLAVLALAGLRHP